MVSNRCDGNVTLKPVSFIESGEGLPYAPMDFPEHGDIWSWNVVYSIRHNRDVLRRDKCLYPPKRFCKIKLSCKKQIKEFIERECPSASVDFDDFWSSFQWNMPAKSLDWDLGMYSYLKNLENNIHLLGEPFKSDKYIEGEGLPYAPVDVPMPGDIWTWRVARSLCYKRNYRYLYPPKRFRKMKLSCQKEVKEYMMRECPNTVFDDFWSSFQWSIPAESINWEKGEISHLGNNGHLLGEPFKSVKYIEGEGLPYAPVDVPMPGDIWSWRVVRSLCYKRNYRYLYPPKRFRKMKLSCQKEVKEYMMRECPNTVFDDFWSSFQWSIPAESINWEKGEISHLGNNGHLLGEPFKSDKYIEGEGLPYAPVDVPMPGDIWSWRVARSLCYKRNNRYLYPPKRFRKMKLSCKKKVKEYMMRECPNTVFDDFWSSFQWSIPAESIDWEKGEISHLGNNGHLPDDPMLFEPGDILCGSQQDEAKTLPDHIHPVLAKLQNGNCLTKIQHLDEASAVREGREKESPMKRKREEMGVKSVEKDIQKIIKRFPGGVSVAVDDDCSSSCLAFETTPLNKRVIETTELASVVNTLNIIKKEKYKSRERSTVGGNYRTFISYADVDGLSPRKWVTGNTIDWYGTKLREMLKRKTAGGHHQQFIICNNFFYTILAADYKKHMEKLEEEEYRNMDFQNQTAMLASKLNKNWTGQLPADDVQSSILIPINYRDNHWALFVVHPVKRTIDLYDPLYNDHDALKNYDEEMKALITMLSMYYVHKDPTANIGWKKNVCRDLPKQRNHYDCGVFVIAYMDCICREVEVKFDEQKGSEHFRFILARDLLEDDDRKLDA